MAAILPMVCAAFLVLGVMMFVGYCMIEIEADDRRIETRRG
jgi:hypothetical protein